MGATSPGQDVTASASPGAHVQAHGSKVTSKLFPVKKTEYFAKARELVANISNLRQFLVETRAAYLNVDTNSMNLKTEFSSPPSDTHSLSRSNSRSLLRRTLIPAEFMTDAEKDQVDMSVQKVIQNSQKRIFEFQKLIESTGIEQDHPQLYIHLGNVINSLSEYLKVVCVVYTEMKAIRVKRSLDLQNVAKLNSTSSTVHHTHNRKVQDESRISDKVENKPGKSSPSPTPSFPVEDSDPFTSMYAEDEYSAEELQIFEEENSLLLQSLRTTSDEVEQIESSIVQIAQLQEIFTEKVLLQDTEISQISNVVIGTTENIKGGNEQLRQAIQQNADFRAWVLFFIIVMSLSLLFLDWYNE